jgi:hypothetical protein
MRRLAILAFVALAASSAEAQSNPRRSQRQELTQMVGDTKIEAMYIRPVARGREIWGALVPYGRVWTPSADSVMRLAFSTDLRVDGQPLPAGSYGIWAIPDSTQWTVIFSKRAVAFHTGGNYQESNDALRVTARVDSLPHVETLTLSFPVVDGKKATLQIHWGTRAVTLPIEVP